MMPESLSRKNGECPICKRSYSEHNYTDYFLLPLHEAAIQNFFISFSQKLFMIDIYCDILLADPQKNSLSSREIGEMFFEVLKQNNISKLNELVQEIDSILPSEKIRRITQHLSKNLEIVKGHYEAYSTISKMNFRNHKNGCPQPKTIEGLLKEPSLYSEFLKDYEEDAKTAYHKVQNETKWITNEILKHEKNVDDFRKK
jgi:hypothetical protein